MIGARKKYAWLFFLALPLVAGFFPAPSAAGSARTAASRGVVYDVYAVDDPVGLRLFWRDGAGRDYRSFGRVKEAVEAGGARLLFATNAGMYHPDRRPVGLYIEEGVEKRPLEAGGGRGNFYMRPNGVFYVDARGAGVMETARFARLARSGLTPRIATQSGPLLLEKGRMHPRFFKDSPYRKLRSGVGVRASGEIVFAISRSPVNFHDFAVFFRDALGCPDALYLDGTISDVYIPALGPAYGRQGLGGDFGPILGEVAP